MLCHDVHGNLTQVKVRANATCRGNAGGGKHVLDDGLYQLPCRLLIQFQVLRQIQEAFIDGIGMDIFGTYVL